MDRNEYPVAGTFSLLFYLLYDKMYREDVLAAAEMAAAATRATHLGGGKTLCRPNRVAGPSTHLRIVDMIEAPFQPTVSSAECVAALGRRSLPRGSTAMIGLPKSPAASISDCIHSLWATYIPAGTSRQSAFKILSSSWRTRERFDFGKDRKRLLFGNAEIFPSETAIPIQKIHKPFVFVFVFPCMADEHSISARWIDRQDGK
jgi:hypothetical protein